MALVTTTTKNKQTANKLEAMRRAKMNEAEGRNLRSKPKDMQSTRAAEIKTEIEDEAEETVVK